MNINSPFILIGCHIYGSDLLYSTRYSESLQRTEFSPALYTKHGKMIFNISLYGEALSLDFLAFFEKI